MSKYSRKVVLVGEVDSALANQFDQLHTELANYRNRIRFRRGTELVTSSVGDQAAWLRQELGLWGQTVKLRGLYLATAKTVAELVDHLDKHTIPGECSTRVETYGSGWNQGKCSQRTRHPNSYVSSIPDCAELATAHIATRELAELANQLDTSFRQFSSVPNKHGVMISPALPDWRTMAKPNCPLSGREAWSVLMLVDRGIPHTRKPNYDSFLGLSDFDYGQLSAIIRQAMVKLRDRKEKSGPAPSYRRGAELYNQARRLAYYPENRDRRSIDYRLGATSSARQRYFADCLVGASHSESASLALVAKLRGDAIGRKMLGKILRLVDGGPAATDMTFSRIAGPPTVVVGRPESIGDHNGYRDYRIPAVWTEQVQINQSRLVAERKYRTKLVEGYILTRQGWNDVYHIAWGELHGCVEAGTRYAQLYPHRVGQPPCPHEVLDQATENYFRWQAEVALQRKGRKAILSQVLRQLRQVPGLSRQDSYRVGNCIPGTTHFLRELGIDLEQTSLPGRLVAQLWRKAGYPSVDRFRGVVELAYKERLRQLDLVWCGLVSGDQPGNQATGDQATELTSSAEGAG